MSKRVVVACVGNPLTGDDGLGCVVASLLRSFRLPQEVEVVDVGVGGLDLLDALRGSSYAIIVDAVRGDEPGKLVRVEYKELARLKMPFPIHVHELGVVEALDLGYSVFPEDMPQRVVLLGVVGQKFEGEGLSQPVRRALPALLRALLDELLNAPEHES